MSVFSVKGSDSKSAGVQAETSASVAPSKLKLKLKNLFIIILSHLKVRSSHLKPIIPLTLIKFLKTIKRHWINLTNFNLF